MSYKLSKEIPSIYPRLNEAFGVLFKDIIIAYGDTIYCADDLPQHSIEHELVHLQQQKFLGAEEWWNLYITDKNFRLIQEVEAYKKQINYLCTHPGEMSRDHRTQWIQKLISDLSGPMYGNIISYQKAKELLGLW